MIKVTNRRTNNVLLFIIDCNLFQKVGRWYRPEGEDTGKEKHNMALPLVVGEVIGSALHRGITLDVNNGSYCCYVRCMS